MARHPDIPSCPGRRRRTLAWLLVPVLVLQSGCASLQPLPTEHQAATGRLAIVSADWQTEIAFEGFASGKGAGAAHGAGSAFMQCMGALGNGSCSGELCGAVVIIMLGLCGVAGVAGGVAGAIAAESAASVQAARDELVSATDARAIQESLRRQIETLAFAHGRDPVTVPWERALAASAAQDYSLLAVDGVDSVLEVALTEAGTRGGGINAPVQLYMVARVRLVSTADNRELFSAEYTHLGPRLRLAAWSANDGKALLQALEQGYAALGSQIHDGIFLLYPFPDRGPHTAGWLVSAFGLAPIEPLMRGQLTGDPLIGRHFEWKTAGSRRPTLRWQTFPRNTDREAAPEAMARVGHVRYDLVIAQEENLAPARIVYRRDGLTGTTHTIETVLRADTGYFWTVRARFELDGRERVTEWGTTNYIVFGRMTSPSTWSYRFRTP